MPPNGGKELDLDDGIVLTGWPEDAARLLEDEELFPDPLLLLLLLLLGTEELCWLTVLEVELDCCADED